MNSSAQKQVIERERIAHHRALETLRDPSCSKSGIQLWRKLCEIERLAHAGATASCNGERIQISWPLFGVREYDFNRDENAWDALTGVATDCVRNVFGCVPAGFFVNGDARGYALKLDPEKVTVPAGMHTDWGRNGILAARIEQ
jgi:hypothetical protein